jgi:hypothetical protein
MRTGTGLIALGLSLAWLAMPAQAGSDASWTTDSNGCKVWNPHPKPNESVTWSGACRDGFADGAGVMQWLVDGNPGTRVETTYVGGKANGTGSLVTASGVRYEGSFMDGARTGKGVMTWPNGARYEGDWVDDQRAGNGTMTWSDGSHYSGQFADDKPANPKLIVQPSFAIKDKETGSLISHEQISGVSVPPEKTYAQLTAEEKRRVKAMYEPMGENDEPPYPLHGQREILDAARKLGQRYRSQGVLSLAVTVGPGGDAISVDVLSSPDRDITRAMATVLMVEKYKPAVCKGSPCRMQYPFRINYLGLTIPK